jgi:lipoyl(octanoyl) transferase
MSAVEWRISPQPEPYTETVAAMERRVAAIRAGAAPELAWLLEHPPLYTRGTSAGDDELVGAPPFPVYQTGRGGRFTYHGPGQRIGYVMLDLKARKPDLRAYVCALEQWLIDTVGDFGIRAERRQGRVGVWVVKPDGSEAKIGAIGVRVRQWVSFHGVSLNVEPDLRHYGAIVPCGIREYGVTSLVDLGVPISMPEVDARLQVNFEAQFGPTVTAGSGALAGA